MPNALIFGVNGQDGSYLAELLLEKGYQIIGWVPASIPLYLENLQPILDRITLVKGDLGDLDSLISCLEEIKPDELYNLAAPSSPIASWGSPVLVGDVVAIGVVRLLEAVKLICPQARFYQASSSEMFGDPVESPQNENTPFQPRNPYGIAKLFAHWMTVRYRQQYGLYAASGILFNHESPRRGQEFVTRKITRHVAQIKMGLTNELRLGNLDARRDWGFAGDFVKAMWMMLQTETPGDFVIGTGETHSVREFCEIAFACVDLDYQEYVFQDPALLRPAEVEQLVADSRKAHSMLGWEPEVSFEQMVRIMVEADLQRLMTLS